VGTPEDEEPLFLPTPTFMASAEEDSECLVPIICHCFGMTTTPSIFQLGFVSRERVELEFSAVHFTREVTTKKFLGQTENLTRHKSDTPNWEPTVPTDHESQL
jgi:hypothetical protein